MPGSMRLSPLDRATRRPGQRPGAVPTLLGFGTTPLRWLANHQPGLILEARGRLLLAMAALGAEVRPLLERSVAERT